jgi:hypothetical protein
MIRAAFIEESGNGRLSVESRSLADELGRRSIPVTLFTAKRLVRRQLKLAPETLVAGSINVVVAALNQLDRPVPEPNDYPVCLRHLLRRRMWTSTVGAVREQVLNGDVGGIFVKPLGRAKRFTGRVFSGPDDMMFFEGASAQLAVTCAEPVRWMSEHRVYFVKGAIVGVHRYDGDPEVRPDEAIARGAVAALSASPEALAGGGLDLGVLSTGETALVELNDGFGLGSYGLADAAYTDLIVARWEEMVGA